MKIRSQVGMVLNLDKCIGCHTCSVTCKTSGPAGKDGIRVQQRESKPGVGFERLGNQKMEGRLDPQNQR